MIVNKYFKTIGYKDKRIGSKQSKNDDMIDKQFTFIDSTMEIDTDTSTVDAPNFNVVENYELFLIDFDTLKFTAKLKTFIDNANADGVCILESEGITVTSERQEQGFLITLTFTIKGV